MSEWQPIETAPKDREILLFGTSEDGEEIVAYGRHAVGHTERWEEHYVSEDEMHKKRVLTFYEYWDSEPEIWPKYWCDLKRPPAAGSGS